MRNQTRLLAAVFIFTDVLATNLAWVLAFGLRFNSSLVAFWLPVTKGLPPFSRYLILLPLISLLWPAVMYFHGLYRFRRGRSWIDEFFAIVFSVLIGSGITLGATLYVRVYYRYQPEVSPAWEYSQGVFAIFILLDVLALNVARRLLDSRRIPTPCLVATSRRPHVLSQSQSTRSDCPSASEASPGLPTGRDSIPPAARVVSSIAKLIQSATRGAILI